MDDFDPQRLQEADKELEKRLGPPVPTEQIANKIHQQEVDRAAGRKPKNAPTNTSHPE